MGGKWKPKIIRDRSNFDVRKTQDFTKPPKLFSNIANEIGDAIFYDIVGYNEIKESIVLQLVSDLSIVLIGDPYTCKSTFVNRIKKNFDFIECFDNLDRDDLEFKKPVLASAKPIYGRFNPSEEIAKQITLSPVTLNKFDVLFILRDFPDKERDEGVAEMMFKEYEEKDLSEIKKSILECRKINPVWTEQAKKRLIDFYVNLRNMSVKVKSDFPSIPINSKQLRTVKKIAEGYSRLYGKTQVELSEVTKAINLLKFYMGQIDER